MGSSSRDRLTAVVLCIACAGVLVLAAQSTSWWRHDKRSVDIGFGLNTTEVCQTGNACRSWSYDQFTRGKNKGVPWRFSLTRIALFLIASLLLAIAVATVLLADKIRAHLGHTLIGTSVAAAGLGYFSVQLFKVDWLAPGGSMGWAFPASVVALVGGVAASHLCGRTLSQRSVERALDKGA